jgi:hypothetical protein
MKTLSTEIDGRKLVFGPLLAATLRQLGPQIRAATQGEMRDVGEQVDLAVAVAHASLSRVDPSITEAQVLAWVDMGNYTEFYAAGMGQSLPEKAPGEVMAGSHSG